MSKDQPPYLQRTQPMDIEDLPLQVALLTEEVAHHRQAILRTAELLALLADEMANLDTPDNDC